MLSKSLTLVQVIFAVTSLSVNAVANDNVVADESVDGDLRVIGKAYDVNTSELRYTESHYQIVSGKSFNVVYALPSGEVFAKKKLEFNLNLSVPAVKQDNQLCGEMIEVNAVDEKNRLEISYRAREGKKPKQKAIKKPKNLVVDAGFDYHVRENWDELVQGDTVEFDFLAPSRLRAYDFKASLVECQSDEGLVCFGIEPDVWYLDVFVDPIVLAYNADKKQLMRFTGLGNIADEKCDYMEVDIRYEYL